MNYVSDTEFMYSPSKWVKRFTTSEEVLDYHGKFTIKESKIIQKTVPCELNIEYGRSKNERFDVFGTDLEDGVPIVIYLHGGYWQMESYNKNNSSYVAGQFHRNNIKCIILEYSLCPEVTIEELIGQLDPAIIKCVQYARKKGTKSIYIAGHSAGAHLAANIVNRFIHTLGVEDQKLFKAAFLISGVYDLEPLIKTSMNNALRLDKITAKLVSPSHQDMNNDTTISIYVIVGQHESPALIKQSKDYYRKLTSQTQTKSNLTVVPNVDHFDIMEKFTDESFGLLKMILEIVQKGENID